MLLFISSNVDLKIKNYFLSYFNDLIIEIIALFLTVVFSNSTNVSDKLKETKAAAL
jgi:hypothetical protein